MKRTISKMLGIAALAIAGIASSFIAATPAQASETILPPDHGVTCARQDGGAYPLNGNFFYCGALTGTAKQNIINAAASMMSSFPSVQSNLSGKVVQMYIFANTVDAQSYFWTGSSDPAVIPSTTIKQGFYNAEIGTLGITYGAQQVSMAYEKLATGSPFAYSSRTTGQIIKTMFHEYGHAIDRSSSGIYESESGTAFGNFTERDQRYLTNTAVSPTAASLRASHSYFINPTAFVPAGIKWHELYAQEFAIKIAGVTGVGDPDTVDTAAIAPYFSCTQAYMKGKLANPSRQPTKADFDSFGPTVYARCVAPFVPATCTNVTSSGSYPYQTTALPAAATGWYVYCGINPTRFQTRSGDKLQTLPTSNPPQWRQKFEVAGYSLYVFRDVAQAVSMLGSAAVPASAQVAGVLGFTQPQILGNATQPFIAMFEQVKQTNGTYVEHPNTNDLFNYDSGLYRESGREIDQLAGSVGSVSSAFRTRITGDITRFNARNGCATSGPDSTLWGSLKTTICDTSGNKKAPYIGVANLAIVRGLTVAQLGSGAVKFPPDYQAMFADTPAASNYSLIWAELIGYKRAGGNRGNDFAAMDVWVNTIYACGKAYTADGYYINAVAPTAACP
jgi:hypothetical protein